MKLGQNLYSNHRSHPAVFGGRLVLVIGLQSQAWADADNEESEEMIIPCSMHRAMGNLYIRILMTFCFTGDDIFDTAMSTISESLKEIKWSFVTLTPGQVAQQSKQWLPGIAKITRRNVTGDGHTEVSGKCSICIPSQYTISLTLSSGSSTGSWTIIICHPS